MYDITKCFDTINHAILIKKFEFYGFDQCDIKRFKSYLHKREQLVSCHNQLSGKCELQVGVQQGSVLGPLLFLIYVNDINRHVHLGSCNLYADDTLVYCTGKNVTELTNNMQICVVAIREWYDMNRLVINNTNFNVMLVTTRQMLSRIDNTDINIYIGDQKLLQCTNINYLGIEIDCTLFWDLQIDILCKKLVFIISKLSRLKAVIPSYLLLLVYTSMIKPKIDYAISIWG